MRGKYKTPSGQILEVTQFDEANKIACVNVDGLHNKWYSENEYSAWESLEPTDITVTEEVTETVSTAETVVFEVEPEPSLPEVAEEVPITPEAEPVLKEKPKKKRTTKKKSK